MVEEEPDFSAMMGQEVGAMPQKENPPQKKTIDLTSDFSAQTSNLERRLRMLEERYGLMQKRQQIIEENMLSANKKFNSEINAISEEISEIRQEIVQVKDKIELIIQELKQSARKEEINVLEHYLELWDPTRFATQADVENIVKRILSQKSESFKKA